MSTSNRANFGAAKKKHGVGSLGGATEEEASDRSVTLWQLALPHTIDLLQSVRVPMVY